MGRGYPEERAYFLAAAAAGRYAALAVPLPEDADPPADVVADGAAQGDGTAGF
jgi:hypothetical protein